MSDARTPRKPAEVAIAAACVLSRASRRFLLALSLRKLPALAQRCLRDLDRFQVRQVSVEAGTDDLVAYESSPGTAQLLQGLRHKLFFASGR
jgi:hypothetical protein